MNLIYLVFYHFSSKKIAAALHVSVEGQFLRVTEGFLHRRDRKLHFRAIVDYACYQGPLMRFCGITGIAMTTTAGGQGASLNVLAVQDATKIRDLLSEIDRLREVCCPACGRCPNCGQRRIKHDRPCPECDLPYCSCCGRCPGCDHLRYVDEVEPCACGHPTDSDLERIVATFPLRKHRTRRWWEFW